MECLHGWISPPINRFCGARAFLGQTPPAGITHACGAVAVDAVADELDIGVILVGRPVSLEIVGEAQPVGQQPVRLEIAQRERKTVVNPDQRGRTLAQPFHQPLGDALAAPVFARRWRRWHFERRRFTFGQIDAQSFQTGGRRFSARIVDADDAGEGG
jgi:hypothetical protein